MRALIAAGVAAAFFVTEHAFVTGGTSLATATTRSAGASRALANHGQDLDKVRLPGTDRWRLRHPAKGRQIEGYANKVSVASGKRVVLKISTKAKAYRVAAYRFGDYKGGAARLVWRSKSHAGHRQAAAIFKPASTRTIVAPWKPSIAVSTRGWPAGAYVFKLIASTGYQSHIPLIVRSRHARGRFALVAPATTWNAYNDWGGYSLYRGPSGDRRSWAVSFNRPFPPPGSDAFLYDVLGVVLRAERLGIPLAYFANVDLDSNPGLLRGATGYASMGHDEYWSTRMRKSVLDARTRGTNLAFFGANTMYWRVRLQGGAEPRVVVGYRHDAKRDPLYRLGSAQTTARYRDLPKPKPENSLIGLQYECVPVDAAYRVVTSRWWGFRGTGVRNGTSFAHLVGIEADRVYPIKSTPRPLQILSHVKYSCRGVPTSSQSIYYTTPSGAGVFAAGTLVWTCALKSYCGYTNSSVRTHRFAQLVTDNLLRAFAHGPVGDRRPAHDNIARFHLSPTNHVSASKRPDP